MKTIPESHSCCDQGRVTSGEWTMNNLCHLLLLLFQYYSCRSSSSSSPAPTSSRTAGGCSSPLSGMSLSSHINHSQKLREPQRSRNLATTTLALVTLNAPSLSPRFRFYQPSFLYAYVALIMQGGVIQVSFIGSHLTCHCPKTGRAPIDGK